MMIAHINIGSNIGDSRSAIERAVAAVFKLSQPMGQMGQMSQMVQGESNPICPISPISPIGPISPIWPISPIYFPRRSSIVESEPWGFESPNKFLNIGVEILTDLPPLELLDRLQAIERSISPASHRNPDGTYRDRIIDLDLIFLLPASSKEPHASLRFSHPRLTLPHPRAAERDFVLAPIRELWGPDNP